MQKLPRRFFYFFELGNFRKNDFPIIVRSTMPTRLKKNLVVMLMGERIRLVVMIIPFVHGALARYYQIVLFVHGAPARHYPKYYPCTGDGHVLQIVLSVHGAPARYYG